MSGILRSKKKMLIVFWVVGIICSIMAQKYVIVLFCVVIIVVMFLIRHINRKVVEITQKQTEIFFPDGKVRNVDCLIIGDMMKVAPREGLLQLSAPDRTLLGAYEILRHTHSILRDDKTVTVIIAVKKRLKSISKYGIFDTLFFHWLILEEKKLYRLRNKAKSPFIYAPLKTLQIYFQRYSAKYEECEVLDDKIYEFCQERGYKIRFFIK